MIEHCRDSIYVRVRSALRRITEERAGVGVERRTIKRGHPAVRNPPVVQMFVVECERGLRTKNIRNSRVHSPSVQIDAIDKVVGAFNHRVQAKCRRVAQLVAIVDRSAALIVAAEREARFTEALEHRFLGYPIDHTAGAATAENHAGRAFQYFDALEVIEIAKDLRIVPHTVEIKIRGRAVAADYDLIAIAFALMHEHAGHVAKKRRPYFASPGLSSTARYDRERGRDFIEGRVGLSRGARARRAVTVDGTISALGFALHFYFGKRSILALSGRAARYCKPETDRDAARIKLGTEKPCHSDLQIISACMAGYPSNDGWLANCESAITWSELICPCWSAAASRVRPRVRSSLRARR